MGCKNSVLVVHRRTDHDTRKKEPEKFDCTKASTSADMQNAARCHAKKCISELRNNKKQYPDDTDNVFLKHFRPCCPKRRPSALQNGRCSADILDVSDQISTPTTVVTPISEDGANLDDILQQNHLSPQPDAGALSPDSAWNLFAVDPRAGNKFSAKCQEDDAALHRHQQQPRRSSLARFLRSDASTHSLDDESVLKIMKCFPFPSPRQNRRNSPNPEKKKTCSALDLECNNAATTSAHACDGENTGEETTRKKASMICVKNKLSDPGGEKCSENGSRYITLGLMVRKTVETTVPPLIPWELWLRKRLADWTQLSGHEGTIVPATERTVWKKRAPGDSHESSAYARLMCDAASCIVPKFYKEVEHKGEYFMEIEDLTRQFTSPCIMDVKMGIRTFLESEVANQKKRPDLYEKMISIDPSEPTVSEHEEKAITKLRYMQFREKESSTASFGFRIEAVKLSGGVLQRDFKKVKTRDELAGIFRQFFTPSNADTRDALVQRLKFMRQKIEESDFFRTHEVIGSSLLIVYDSSSCGAWMIDFAKAVPVEGRALDHRTTWKFGNHEDGYLFGLDNLIRIVEETNLDEQL